MEQLLIRLGNRYEDTIHWLVWSTEEKEIIASGELQGAKELGTLSQRAGQRPVIALAPSNAIALKWVELPPKAGRKVLNALPFMLEEELATDIGELFFAMGERVDNKQAVAVVERALLSEWQGWLEDAGLYVPTMIPDVLAVPHHEGQWSLLTLGDALLVRQDSFTGIQGETNWLVPLLNHVTAKHEEQVKIANYSDLDLSSVINIEQQSQPLELPMHVLAQAAMASQFNLLQNEFKVKKRSTGAFKQWRIAAVLAVVAFSTTLVDKVVTLQQLKTQVAAVKAEVQQETKRGFPRLGPTRDLRRKLQSELRKLEGGAGDASLLAMLEQLSGAFAQTQVKPQTLKFDAQRTELRVQAVASNFDRLEQFKQLVQQAGFSVEEGAINNRDNQVIGSLVIRSA